MYYVHEAIDENYISRKNFSVVYFMLLLVSVWKAEDEQKQTYVLETVINIKNALKIVFLTNWW